MQVDQFDDLMDFNQGWFCCSLCYPVWRLDGDFFCRWLCKIMAQQFSFIPNNFSSNIDASSTVFSRASKSRLCNRRLFVSCGALYFLGQEDSRDESAWISKPLFSMKLQGSSAVIKLSQFRVTCLIFPSTPFLSLKAWPMCVDCVPFNSTGFLNPKIFILNLFQIILGHHDMQYSPFAMHVFNRSNSLFKWSTYNRTYRLLVELYFIPASQNGAKLKRHDEAWKIPSLPRFHYLI